MDSALLGAVADELRERLAGHLAADVVQLESHRFVLRFDGAPFPRLHVGIHPHLSTVHLARGLKAPSHPTELAMAMTRELEGRQTTAVEKPEGERMLILRFGPDRGLVVELMGKASNMLLLDEEGRILRYARTHKGGFRRPEEGALYEPPPKPPGSESGGEFALSIALTREIDHLVGQGGVRGDIESDLRRRLAEKPEPVLYTPEPFENLSESVDLSPASLFAFPFPLQCAAGLIAVPFETVNEAEEAATQCRVAHLRFVARRDALCSLLRSERKKSRSLMSRLNEELETAGQGGERDRRNAEMILAGLHSAAKGGDVVRVPDVYGTPGSIVSIRIDPRLGLKANAEKLFKSARKADRTLRAIPPRLEALRGKIDDLERGAERLARARTRERLEEIERELQDQGLVKAMRREAREEIGRKADYVPVREFVTSDGFRVLVGRSSADNDHLTFKVASPHDLWFHAAGHPGAHVVLKNPGRLQSIPETSVREAAGVAAHFSRAGKGGAPIEVHVAWRRHVKKGRGMSPGMVMLRRHRSVRVEPALPGKPDCAR